MVQSRVGINFECFDDVVFIHFSHRLECEDTYPYVVMSVILAYRKMQSVFISLLVPVRAYKRAYLDGRPFYHESFMHWYNHRTPETPRPYVGVWHSRR